ncbi:MAG: hypothetical protein ACK5BN_03000, partial [Planctomycetota bacterium]
GLPWLCAARERPHPSGAIRGLDGRARHADGFLFLAAMPRFATWRVERVAIAPTRAAARAASTRRVRAQVRSGRDQRAP